MTQITDLPQAQTPLSPGDIVLVIQSGTPKQVAQSQIGTQEAITPGDLPIATNSLVGAVKPDGSSITVAPDGTITSHSSVTGATITGTPSMGNLAQFSGSSTITNGDLTGDVTTSGGLATTIHKISGVTVSSTTGTTNLVFSNSPILVTPNLGTPSALVGTNISGIASGLTSGTVTIIPTLTGDIQNTGNATTVTAIQGTFVAGTSGTGNVVFENSPTLITPALGTPSSVDLVNASGTALNLTAGALSLQSHNSLAGFSNTGAYANVTIGSGLVLTGNSLAASASAPTFNMLQSGTNTTAAMLVGTGSSLASSGSGTIVSTSTTGNAATVTTNANLTGPITSSGNTTSVGSQTGTGSTFVMSVAPTITGHATLEGVTSTGATGTGNFVFGTSPTLVTPALGTPTAIVLTNATGTAASLTAGTATALANNTINSLAGFNGSGIYSDVTVSTGLSLSGGVLTATGTSPTFAQITSGTNTTAAMLVGTGSSLASSGSGTITATAAPIGGVSGLGTGVATFLATPSSANLLSALTTSTGTGTAVFSNDPVVTGGLTVSSGNVLFGATATSSGAFNYVSNGQNSWFGIYDSSSSQYYGIAVELPAPSGVAALAGYYSGLGVGGSEASGGTDPIFGVLTSSQSGNGLGKTALTVYANQKVLTFNNTLDDGSGNIIVVGHATLEGVTSTGATGTGNFVFGTSPTLVTPALGTPASGVLTHCTGTAAGLTAGTVTTNANLTGPVTSSGNTTTIASSIALPGSPTTTTQTALTNNTTIATTAYTDSAVTAALNGLDWKQACTVATTANLVGTYLSGVFTMTATGVLTIDGQTATLNNTYLLKNQTTGTQNGAYTCTTAGTTGVASVFTRRSDYNTTAKIQSGDTFFIQQGTTNGGTAWSLTTAPPITLDTTSLTFSQVSGPGTYTAGTGLTLTGVSFNVNSSQSIATLSNLTSNGIVTTSGGVGTLSITGTTGSGSVVLATSPTLVTPALGTPASGVLTNCTGSPTFTTVTSALSSTTNNAVTVTTNAGTCPITSSLNTFTNSSAATMAITIATASAVDGQRMMVRVYDFSAAAETIGWTNTENSTVTVPTTSNGSTTLPLTVGFVFNGQTSKWRCVAVV